MSNIKLDAINNGYSTPEAGNCVLYFPDSSLNPDYIASKSGSPELQVQSYHRLAGRWTSRVKRIEDIVFAALLILATLPAILLIAIAIKAESNGPILFRQERFGMGGRRIKVLKFRSMYHNERDELCDRQTQRGDRRVTRVGAFLRRHSLDEIPQLFNVLRGDMSLVGPRPHAINTNLEGRLLEEVVEDYALRHRVKPGITGWAQVNGWRGNVDTAEKLRGRVEHDIYYIENWSFYLDICIICRTLACVWRDDSAY